MHGSPTLPQLPSEPGNEPGLPHPSWHPTQNLKRMERRAESESSKVSSIPTHCATSGAPNSPCLSLPFQRKGSEQNSPKGLLTHRPPPRVLAAQLSGSGPQRVKAWLWAQQPKFPVWLPHLRSAYPQSSDASLSLSFLICKMGSSGGFSEAV